MNVYRRQLPRADPKTQTANDLDNNLLAWRESEIEELINGAITLRDTVTSVDEALESMEGYMNILRRLAVEVRAFDSGFIFESR
jgi:hypothetical protein